MTTLLFILSGIILGLLLGIGGMYLSLIHI